MTKKICLIGAGLSGGIVASHLSNQGHQVKLIEQGSKPEPYQIVDEDWEYDRPDAAFTRGIGIGGTSNFWHGGLTALDKTDVEGRSEFFDDVKIPIKYTELRNYYNEAINFMRGSKNYSLKDIESAPKSESNEFNINSGYFRYKGLLYPTRPFSTKKIIEKAKIKSGLRVVHNFEVKRINFSNKSRVASIEGYDSNDGTIKKIHADVFIFCAGGLGSPKILLESAKESQALKGLPIGKFIIDHPTGFVFKAKLRRRMELKNLFGQPGAGYRVQYGFALNPDKLNIANQKNHILFLRPAVSMKDPLIYDFLKRKLVGYKGKRLKISDIGYLFRHIDLLYEALNFKFGLFHSTNYVSGLTFLEQFPNDQNCIAFNQNNRFSIKWKISKDDSLSIEKFLETFFQRHADIFEDYIIFPKISKRLETSGHHSGGCRMSSDPAKGVVDSNLKVFGVDNLFVVDGSVLGYSGHANTGLTISALALKCANVIQNL